MYDTKSCSDDDFFELFLHYRDSIGENYITSHSPKHKWWYFPHMIPNQVILLKTFDSATDVRARFVSHTAFDDPTSPANATMREIVETRTICAF